MNILYIYRHPNMGFSIEKVFRPIEKEMKKYAEVDSVYMPIANYKPIGLLQNINYVRRIVRYKKYDIVHITGAEHYLIPFLRAQKLIVTVHDLGIDQKKSLKFIWRYCLWIKTLQFADRLTFVSHKTYKETLEYCSLPDNKCMVIPNPLGQEFCKSYQIQYQSKNNTLEYPFNTSHGLTTRIIGAVIMVHGDDNGLVLPPSIAPIQIKILPLFVEKNPEVKNKCEEIKNNLKQKYRVEIDYRGKNFGYMQSECEIQGIPISIVIGPNDLNKNCVTLIRRDNFEKKSLNLDELESEIDNQLSLLKKSLYEKAAKRLNSSIIDVSSIKDMSNVLDDKKWARAYFNGTIEDEKKIKELTGATPRCIITNSNIGKCIITGNNTSQLVIFARAY